MSFPCFSLHLAGLMSIPAYYIAIIVPIIAMIFGGAIAISAMYFQNQRRRMWHETTRVALEKGQPLPANPFDKFGRDAAEDMPPFPREYSGKNDLRAGLILLGVAAGLYLFFDAMGMRPFRYVGAIPGFIGVALLLYGLLALIFSKHKSGLQDRPPRT